MYFNNEERFIISVKISDCPIVNNNLSGSSIPASHFLRCPNWYAILNTRKSLNGIILFGDLFNQTIRRAKTLDFIKYLKNPMVTNINWVTIYNSCDSIDWG